MNDPSSRDISSDNLSVLKRHKEHPSSLSMQFVCSDALIPVITFVPVVSGFSQENQECTTCFTKRFQRFKLVHPDSFSCV